MTSDSDLHQALEQIAAHAPDSSALHARLADRIRAHRQRRAILTTAAAVLGAGAAAGVPAATALSRRPAPPPIDPRPTPSLTPATAASASLHLRPTWIPDGLVAFSRRASVLDINSEQEWLTPQECERRLLGAWPADRAPTLTFSVRQFPPEAPERSSAHFPLSYAPNTTVGDRPAVTLASHDLEWMIADDVVARLESNPIGPSLDLRRVAASVVQDEGAVCEVSVRAGWIPTLEGPDVVTGQALRMRGTGKHWLQEVNYGALRGSVGVEVSIKLAHIPSAANIFEVFDQAGLHKPFEEMTLGGRAGRVRYHPSGSGVEEFFEVIFDLPNGRFAQVKSGFPFGEPDVLRANTIRAAEELLIGPDPAWPWLGRPLG